MSLRGAFRINRYKLKQKCIYIALGHVLEFSARSNRMRIQEMKSGFLHLKKRMENEGPKNYFDTPTVADVMINPETGTASPLDFDCELDEPRWSVVSFEKLEAGGLTYAQASALRTELDDRGIAGLCIVSDEATSRLRD